jgi:hypothetical protein
MSHKPEDFINTLHDKMGDYAPRQLEDRSLKNKRTYLKKGLVLLYGIWDFMEILFLRNKIFKNQVSIYYTHSSFIKFQNNQFEDSFFGEILEPDNSVFISYDKFNYIKKIEGIRVYNLGVFVRILSRFGFVKKTTKQENYNEWEFVNSIIAKKLTGNKIFVSCYSNECGFSLVFNRYRNNYTLIEIQHGNVINYPPYSFISDRHLVDVFYCRDERSKLFLEDNLFNKFSPKLIVLNTKQVQFLPQTDKVEILYVSSYEFSGFHPVFESFLFSRPANCNVKIRLHPRQIDLEDSFIECISKSGVNYEIDRSKFWFESIPLNTFVISPLSSVIEEAVNLGLKSIIIDSAGAKRYEYLIDNKLCFFSENLSDSILKINK